LEITLSEKATHSRPDLFKSAARVELTKIASGLKAEVKDVQVTDSGWVRAILAGEDADVLAEALRRRFGEVPLELPKIVRGRVYRGWITKPVGYGIYVDIGLLSPRKDALYPLYACRAQLCDGAKLPARKVADMFGLVEDRPISVWVEEVREGEGAKVSIQLSETQRDELMRWKELPFQRILVLGALGEEVDNAIVESSCEWDIPKVDSPSLTTHILTCKIGTEAPGIIAKIGPRLKGARLHPVFPDPSFR